MYTSQGTQKLKKTNITEEDKVKSDAPKELAFIFAFWLDREMHG